MKLKQLEGYLEQVEVFKNPKVELEQYPTTPHIAAHMLYTIERTFGDIEGRLVGDLGCGCGFLTVGSCMLGSALSVGFDVDSDALEVASGNFSDSDIVNVDLVQCDLVQMSKYDAHRWTDVFDTVIMNPPFGTKSNRGIDLLFVERALDMTNNVVYSLHKTSTRDHIKKKSAEWGVEMEVLAELRFDLPSTYKFHRKHSVDIEVDFIRFNLQNPTGTPLCPNSPSNKP